MAKHAAPPITFDNFTILDSGSNINDLRILESLYIFKDRPVSTLYDLNYYSINFRDIALGRLLSSTDS